MTTQEIDDLIQENVNLEDALKQILEFANATENWPDDETPYISVGKLEEFISQQFNITEDEPTT